MVIDEDLFNYLNQKNIELGTLYKKEDLTDRFEFELLKIIFKELNLTEFDFPFLIKDIIMREFRFHEHPSSSLILLRLFISQAFLKTISLEEKKILAKKITPYTISQVFFYYTFVSLKFRCIIELEPKDYALLDSFIQPIDLNFKKRIKIY